MSIGIMFAVGIVAGILVGFIIGFIAGMDAEVRDRNSNG